MGAHPFEELRSQNTFSGALVTALKLTRDYGLSPGTFLDIVDLALEHEHNIHTELVRVISTRAHLQRRELHMDVDKPRIVIPPNINIGERDIQLKFYSVGDGMKFELKAEEGETGEDWYLLNFIPGKGLYLFPGVGFSTTPDFPTDGVGRLQVIDREQKKMVLVYPEQVKEDGPELESKAVNFLGWKWYLEERNGMPELRGLDSKGHHWHILRIEKDGITRFSHIGGDCPVKTDDDGRLEVTDVRV